MQLLFIKIVMNLGSRADLSSFSVMKTIDCLTWVALGNNKHFGYFNKEYLTTVQNSSKHF